MKLTPAEKAIIGATVTVAVTGYVALWVWYAATLRAWGMI